MSKGKIIQVMGPVVDVAFEDDGLPHIKDALVVDNQGKKCVMEVAQHVGGNVVRCIMLASSAGLCKDMEVEPTGAGIQVPVGEKTLGRLFNVLGETIDGGDVYKRQDTDGAFPQRRHGPCGPQLCDRIHIRCPGGVLLQRAECQDDGHAVC